MEPLHVLRAPVRKRTATACVFALLTFVPASASPQNGRVLDRSPAIAGAQPGVFVDAAQGVFVEGLSELTAAVGGMYGDEGARIGPALDKMARGLAEWDRAIRVFEARLALERRDASAHAIVQMRVALAGMYVKRGRLDAALKELDAATDLEPQRADPRLLRGLVLDASGRSAEAGEAFRTAWALDASDPIKAYHVLRHAATIGETRDVQKARELLRAAYLRLLENGARARASPFATLDLLHDRPAETPVLASVAYARGYTRIAQGEYNEAIAEFRKAAAIDPLVTDPATRSVSMMQAVAALRQGRPADALSLLKHSDALENSTEAHRILGLAYWTDGQDDKSIEELEIAIRRNPRDERARLVLARVLSSAGRDSDAERALRETIQVLPGSALAHWWLGRGYERVNRFADARREYELASTSAVAGRSQFYGSIGRLARDAADIPGAITAFARSVTASPNDPIVHKSFAGALLQQDRTDEAFVELVAALLIDPVDADAHASIGQIHLNAGRYDEAVTALGRAVELSANDTEARYALATALMRLGNTQRAAREFERVEQEQRQMLADRRRTISLDVLREEAALRAAEGRYDRATALWQQVVDREPGGPSNHLGLAAALARAGRIDTAIAHYEKAIALGADPVVYRQLAELYSKVGRIDDAARARAMYDRALRENSNSRGTPR